LDTVTQNGTAYGTRNSQSILAVSFAESTADNCAAKSAKNCATNALFLRRGSNLVTNLTLHRNTIHDRFRAKDLRHVLGLGEGKLGQHGHRRTN